MNNFTECPVCKASGIKKGSSRCPRCNSDLEILGQIENLEERSSGSTAALMVAYFLVLACVVSFLLFYFFVFKDIKASSDVNKSQIKQLTTTIEGLKTENEQYLQQIIDLRTQIGGGAESVVLATKTKKEPDAQVQTNPVKQLPALQSKKQVQPAAQSGIIFHEVQPGESLRRIAKKYFGDMDQYPKIMKDNNIKTPDQIYPGQKLKIIR
jgi:LysM repeat protein